MKSFFQFPNIPQNNNPKTSTQYQLESDRYAAFGKKYYQTLIGQPILPQIDGFYYMTNQLMIMPQFESVLVAYRMHKQMAEYIHMKHSNNFIVYNLTVKQDLSMFNQVLDYGIKKENLAPPLHVIFLIVVEMAQWISKDPRHVVVMHESPIEMLIVSCLMSVLHKQLFSATIANQYVSKMACKTLDESMLRYLNYFDQVYQKEFTPLTKRLLLQKVVIMTQEDNLYLQIHQCQGANFQKMIYHHHEKLHQNNQQITDQFLSNKELGSIVDLSKDGVEVINDFQIRVIKYGKIEEMVGEPVCLHASFIEGNFIRVQVCNGVELDLIFSEPKGVLNNNYSFDEEDMLPEVTGQKINLKKVIKKYEESKDQFWLSLIEQLKGDQITKPKVKQIKPSVVKKIIPKIEDDEEEFVLIDDEDLPIKQQKQQPQPILPANVFVIDDSKSPAQSSPEEDEQIFKANLIPSSDEQQLSSPEKLDSSFQSISSFGIGDPIEEATNIINDKANQNSDDEYDKYLDQLESAEQDD